MYTGSDLTYNTKKMRKNYGDAPFHFFQEIVDIEKSGRIGYNQKEIIVKSNNNE